MSVVSQKLSPTYSIFSPEVPGYESFETADCVKEEYCVTLSRYREVADKTPGDGLPESNDLVEFIETEDQSYAVINLSEVNYSEKGVSSEVYLELGEELEQKINEGNIKEKEFRGAAKKLRSVEKTPGVSRADGSVFDYYGELLK